MKYKLYKGDCLEVMDKLIEEGVKVDAIICDPPYGKLNKTKTKWDNPIPYNKMWERLEKLAKETTPIVLFGSEPFSSELRLSNLKDFKYDWIWEKSNPSNIGNANRQPLNYHEIISVFSKKKHFYKPIKTKGKPYISGKGTSGDITLYCKANGSDVPFNVFIPFTSANVFASTLCILAILYSVSPFLTT